MRNKELWLGKIQFHCNATVYATSYFSFFLFFRLLRPLCFLFAFYFFLSIDWQWKHKKERNDICWSGQFLTFSPSVSKKMSKLRQANNMAASPNAVLGTDALSTANSNIRRGELSAILSFFTSFFLPKMCISHPSPKRTPSPGWHTLF